MLVSNISQRVLRISNKRMTATGYTIEKGENQYLVSAAHAFNGREEVKEIWIYHENTWKPIPVKVVFNDTEYSDTIVFKLPLTITPKLEIHRTTVNVILGTWAYILGFPLGLYTPAKGINNNFPVPFIKAGLVSSIILERHGVTSIYLDGHNNKGFSGGPVVWYPDNNLKDVRVIGTVSGYIREPATHNETMEDIESHQVNAGIIQAYHVNDLEKHLP